MARKHEGGGEGAVERVSSAWVDHLDLILVVEDRSRGEQVSTMRWVREIRMCCVAIDVFDVGVDGGVLCLDRDMLRRSAIAMVVWMMMTMMMLRIRVRLREGLIGSRGCVRDTAHVCVEGGCEGGEGEGGEGMQRGHIEIKTAIM